MESFNIVVCAPGGGGNFCSLIEYQCNYGYHISLLIVDREYPVIKIAKENGISYSVLEKKVLDKSFFGELEKVVPIDTNLIVLTGFPPIIPKWVCEKWERKMINIHPSLLPKYRGKSMYGVRAQETVLRNHEKYAGYIVHCVDSEVDAGEIVIQRKILVMENESAQELEGRVFNEEIVLLPLVIKHIREAVKVIP